MKERDRILNKMEEFQADTRADRRKDLEPEPSQRPNDEEYESDSAEEVDGASEDEAQMSIFRPVAGVQGNAPRYWRDKGKRRESSDYH